MDLFQNAEVSSGQVVSKCNHMVLNFVVMSSSPPEDNMYDSWRNCSDMTPAFNVCITMCSAQYIALKLKIFN